MRDIRPDLRERLETIARERARLDQMEAGIKVLLQQEDHRFLSSQNGNGDGDSESDGTPLRRFLLATLQRAKKPLTVDDFKTAANGNLDFGDKAPGRVLHRGLVGMAQGGTVEKVSGKWRLKEATQ